MSQPLRPFEHQDPDRKTDEALRQEARAHLGDTPPLQLVAELLGKLRALDLPWWSPEALRARWSATDRMRWYRTRPDLRQHVSTLLTGLAPRAARKKTPEFQGALLDSVIDEGDVTAKTFDASFDPCDMVVYGPVDEFWHAFVERMPWGEDTPLHQELCAWLFDALLADRSTIEGLYRKPILTAWDARTSIDGRVWHTRMPLEIRVAIDEARFTKQRDRATEPFHAASDLSIAVSATIAASIQLKDLAPVFATAEREMGFRRSSRPDPKPGKDASPRAGEAAPPTAAPIGAAAVRPSVAPPPSMRVIPPIPASKPPQPAAFAPATPPPPQSAPRKIDPPVAPPDRSDPGRSAVAAIGRLPSSTIPDGLDLIPGEEERTNPWDIPSDASVDERPEPRAEANALHETGSGSRRRRSGKG